MARQNLVGVTLRRTAGEVKRYRVLTKLLPVGIATAVMVLVIGYVVSVLYMKFGAFTVMVNKYDNLEYALTLSETPDFQDFTSRLNAEIAEEVTNINVNDLPNWLDNVDGAHNGDNYVAYTFYCKNAGTQTVTYTYELYIANMTQNVEKAIRVRLYVDGEYKDYAYPRTDGVEGPEPGTEAFQSGTTIVKRNIQHFKPDDVTKYTVVIWIEGDDPECVDNIINGEFKIDMAMSILSAEDEDGTTREL